MPASAVLSTTRERHAEALFASTLQASQTPSANAVRAAVADAELRLDTVGLAAHMANAYGECPETATARMAWARRTIDRVYGPDIDEPRPPESS